MKAKYHRDADLLSLKISRKPYVFARQEGDVIVHYSKDREPVLIEIVNAAEFIKQTNKSLPKDIQRAVLHS